MYRIIILTVVLLVLAGIGRADEQEGQKGRPVLFTQKTLASSVTVGVGATWTSATFDVRYTEYQSIYWSATGVGGAASGVLAVSCSIDETNFADPATPIVATLAANGSGVRAIAVPICRFIKFTFQNTSGVAITWTAIGGCQ